MATQIEQIFCVFLLCVLALNGVNARRCHISPTFQRYCGKHQVWYGVSVEQCRSRCDARSDCLVAHWHPARQIWKTASRPVCLWFKVSDKNLKVCPWRKGAFIGAHPGAKMIRCSKTQNNEIERCYPDLNNFQRHCGEEVPGPRLYGESSERCRQICNDNAACHVAHWHPPGQIWKNSKKSVCFMFLIGTKVCKWNGEERIKFHPGAQMIRCINPTIVSFSYDVNSEQVLSNTPQVLGKIDIANHCPKKYLKRCPDQQKTLSVSKTTESSKSWEHEAGVSVTVGTEFSAGIPILAEGKVSVEVTGSYSHTWGKSETESKTWSVEDQCVATAGVKATCQLFVVKRQTNVPFKILWSTGEYTHGLYRGVDFLYGGTTVKYTFLTEKKK